MPEARVTERQKAEVYQRASGRCEYCRAPATFSPDPFAIEHIQPRAHGGPTELENLALACHGCNSFKHTATEAVDPATGAMVRLFNPRRDRWREHFMWSDDYTAVIGQTAVGRATIVRLQLNRLPLVNLRRLLYPAGEHPPTEDSSSAGVGTETK